VTGYLDSGIRIVAVQAQEEMVVREKLVLVLIADRNSLRNPAARSN